MKLVWLIVAALLAALGIVATYDGVRSQFVPLAIVVSPASPTVSCSAAAGTFFAIVALMGTSAKHASLALTAGDTSDFALEKAHAPTYLEVGPNGIDPGNCDTTQSVTVTATGPSVITQMVSINVGTPGPLLSFSPSSLSFGSEVVGGSTSPRAITITNVGGSTFTFSGISIGGTDPGDYGQTNTCGATLAAGANCAVNVTFTPTAVGSRTATAVVTGGGSVPLSGTGTTATAYYVATTGNDSNPGTLSQPFATLGKCQTAMQGGSTKTCYVRAGTYTPTGVSTSGCSAGLTAVLYLTTPADDGETWSYYPADGYGTAVINGQASGTSGIGYGVCNQGNNVTIDGLYWEHYRYYGLLTYGSGALIENNTVDGIVDTTLTGSACIATGSAVNGVITNNYCKNSVDLGIATFPGGDHQVDNLLIENNFVYNACSYFADCGGVYFEFMECTPTCHVYVQTNVRGKYNYVKDIYGGGGGSSYYVDDKSCGVTLVGNVAAHGGTDHYPGFLIHGGCNNIFGGGNIVDLGADTGAQIVTTQNDGVTMSGNSWQNNLIVAGASGMTGGGYPCNTQTCQLDNTDNAYFNYVGSSVITTGDVPSGTGDTNPTQVNPSITCGWTYALSPTSPVYAAPVSFPTQPAGWGSAGFWGPPGFTIPRSGTAPSPPHSC
jgi:hypothetical protein